jgi:hypothetical protein
MMGTQEARIQYRSQIFVEIVHLEDQEYDESTALRMTLGRATVWSEVGWNCLRIMSSGGLWY